MMLVNEDWRQPIFGRCSRKMKSCLMRDKVTGGEEERKHLRDSTARLVFILFHWVCGSL